jgi:hypothetical protein
LDRAHELFRVVFMPSEERDRTLVKGICKAGRPKGGRGDDIPRLRIVLFKLNLMKGNNLALSVEDEEAGAGSSLVNGTNKSLSASWGHCVAVLGDGLLDKIGQHSVDSKGRDWGKRWTVKSMYARQRAAGQESRRREGIG